MRMRKCAQQDRTSLITLLNRVYDHDHDHEHAFLSKA